jgi:hypothetical protein
MATMASMAWRCTRQSICGAQALVEEDPCYQRPEEDVKRPPQSTLEYKDINVAVQPLMMQATSDNTYLYKAPLKARKAKNTCTSCQPLNISTRTQPERPWPPLHTLPPTLYAIN